MAFGGHSSYIGPDAQEDINAASRSRKPTRSEPFAVRSVSRCADVVDAIQVLLQSVALTLVVRTFVVPSVLGRIAFPEPVATYLTEKLSLFARIAV